MICSSLRASHVECESNRPSKLYNEVVIATCFMEIPDIPDIEYQQLALWKFHIFQILSNSNLLYGGSRYSRYCKQDLIKVSFDTQ